MDRKIPCLNYGKLVSLTMGSTLYLTLPSKPIKISKWCQAKVIISLSLMEATLVINIGVWWLPGLDDVDNKFTMFDGPHRMAPGRGRNEVR